MTTPISAHEVEIASRPNTREPENVVTLSNDELDALTDEQLIDLVSDYFGINPYETEGWQPVTRERVLKGLRSLAS